MHLRLAALAVLTAALACPRPAAAGGLHVRLAVGAGVAAGREDTAGTRESGADPAVATEIAIGGHVRPGLVVGGGTFPMVVPGPGYHLSATGPFVAIERGRVRLQAAVLVTAGYHEARDGHDAAIGFGAGAMAGVAYDVRRGPRWSIGPLVRVTYVHWSGGDYTLDKVAPSLLVAFTRH